MTDWDDEVLKERAKIYAHHNPAPMSTRKKLLLSFLALCGLGAVVQACKELIG